MIRISSRSMIIGLLVTAVIAGGAVFAAHTVGPRGSGLSRALEVLPSDTLSVGYTDWSRVGDAVGIDPETSGARDEFDDRARERDLTTRSVLGGMSEKLFRAFGWSLSDLDWDAYGQSRAGNVMVMGLGSDLPASKVVESLRKAGYKRSDGIWRARSDEFRRAHPDLPTELNNVMVLNRRTLLVASHPNYLKDVHESSGSLAAQRDIRDAAEAVTGSTTALLRAGSLGCKESRFQDAGETARSAARAEVGRYGRLRDYRAAARAIDTDNKRQSMRFAMTFDSEATATEQAQVRRKLTRGPFTGRGGDIQDALRLRSARASGDSAVLSFDHDASVASVMDAVGPLIFASCSLS